MMNIKLRTCHYARSGFEAGTKLALLLLGGIAGFAAVSDGSG